MKNPSWILCISSCFIALFVSIVILVFRPRKIVRAPLSVTPIKLTFAGVPPVDKAIIYKNDIFGTLPVLHVVEEKEYILPTIPAPPMMSPVQMPHIMQQQFLGPLNVTVKGIMYSCNERENGVIIADNQTKKETLYSLGDQILDAQIIYISAHKIICIRSNGQQETLFVTPAEAQEDITMYQKKRWDDVVKQTGEFSYIIVYECFIEKIKNLASFFDMIDMTTSFIKGKIVGCRVGKMQQGSVGYALGLKSDDIIISVDNIATSSTAYRKNILSHLQAIQHNAHVPIELLRHGKKMVITYIIHKNTDITMNEQMKNRVYSCDKDSNEQKINKEYDQKNMMNYGGNDLLLRHLND